MDWTEIKEKYPKAWEKFTLKWAGIWRNSHFRELYDFFDGEGIIIEVTLSYHDKENWFEYSIDLLWDRDDWYCSNDEPDYNPLKPYKTKTRTEAEEQAFLKAFEVLENKLK